jgi:hypothetical protein
MNATLSKIQSSQTISLLKIQHSIQNKLDSFIGSKKYINGIEKGQLTVMGNLVVVLIRQHLMLRQGSLTVREGLIQLTSL